MLANSYWQIQIGVCVDDTTTCWQTVGEKLTRIETSSIFRQQFANMLCRSHTPIWDILEHEGESSRASQFPRSKLSRRLSRSLACQFVLLYFPWEERETVCSLLWAWRSEKQSPCEKELRPIRMKFPRFLRLAICEQFYSNQQSEQSNYLFIRLVSTTFSRILCSAASEWKSYIGSLGTTCVHVTHNLCPTDHTNHLDERKTESCGSLGIFFELGSLFSNTFMVPAINVYGRVITLEFGIIPVVNCTYRSQLCNWCLPYLD